MQNCCVTCGGGAPTVDDALRVFARAAAGAPWPVDQVAAAASAESNEERERPQDPQSGLWVGAAASVTLSHCRIFACLGPGIKIYRGALVATHNTVGFSRRGANVVANGGAVVLKHNEIVGALGDGVSSWNNSQLVVESNRIHANAGAGIAINSGGAPPSPPLFRHCRLFRFRHHRSAAAACARRRQTHPPRPIRAGGSVAITENSVFENAASAVLFATSQTKQATLQRNDFDRNTAGAVPASTRWRTPPPRLAPPSGPSGPSGPRARRCRRPAPRADASRRRRRRRRRSDARLSPVR